MEICAGAFDRFAARSVLDEGWLYLGIEPGHRWILASKGAELTLTTPPKTHQRRETNLSIQARLLPLSRPCRHLRNSNLL